MRSLLTILNLLAIEIMAVGAFAPTLLAQPPAQTADRATDQPNDAQKMEPAEAQGGEAAPIRADLSEGLWPSRTLLRLALTRLVDDACDRYDMDDEQRDAVRREMIDEWESYLTDHRNQLQPLFNEFLEMRLSLEPPDEDRVKAWADRATPAFAQVRDRIEQSWANLRDVLKPLQRAKFEVEVLAARAGLSQAQARLDRWRKGSFENFEVWEPRDHGQRLEARKERRERRAQRREEIDGVVQAGAPDQLDQELDRWDVHVAEFVARYNLDEGQRSTALSLLAEMKQRARDHRERYREDIDRLERRIEDPAPNDKDRNSIKDELIRLYGPIDELFAELVRRLDPIPNQHQREARESSKKKESE